MYNFIILNHHWCLSYRQRSRKNYSSEKAFITSEVSARAAKTTDAALTILSLNPADPEKTLIISSWPVQNSQSNNKAVSHPVIPPAAKSNRIPSGLDLPSMTKNQKIPSGLSVPSLSKSNSTPFHSAAAGMLKNSPQSIGNMMPNRQNSIKPLSYPKIPSGLHSIRSLSQKPVPIEPKADLYVNQKSQEVPSTPPYDKVKPVKSLPKDLTYCDPWWLKYDEYLERTFHN